MAWASEVAATQLTSITTEQFFSFAGSTTVSLNPGESIHVQVTADFPGSPTDALIVSIYGSLDGTDWDLTPFIIFQVDKDLDPNRESVIVSGLYNFRIGVKRSGSTDTITSADCSHRKDGISI